MLARLAPRLAEHGLTPTQLGVLEAILHKGPLTQRELGRKVLTSAGNMTDVIGKLERRNLITRCHPEADRRSLLVDLTPAGRALIERVFPVHAQDIAEAMAGLSAAELDRLGQLLRKLGMAAAGTPTGLAEDAEQSHVPADRSISNE